MEDSDGKVNVSDSRLEMDDDCVSVLESDDDDFIDFET